MTDWIMLVPSFVFSRIKAEFSEKLKTQYGMSGDHFSTVNQNQTDSRFPFVYVHMISSAEQGGDLEGSTVNAALFAFQVDVYDNQSQGRAREVMGEVVRIMKTMRFQVTSMPEFERSSNGVYRSVARFSRVIGAGDIL